MLTRTFGIKAILAFFMLLLVATEPMLAQEGNPPAPNQVTIGAYINDIQSIDLRSHTYAMDAYIWFRWTNPALNPAETLEFTNPSDLWYDC